MGLGLVFSILAATGFGIMSIVAKLAYDQGLDAPGLLQIRFTTAVPLMALVLLIKDRRLLIPTLPVLLKAAVLGGALYGLQSATFFVGLTRIPASTSALILYLYPLVVTLLSVLFLKMKLDRLTVLSLVCVAGGCGLVFYDAFQRGLDPLGLMLVGVATLTFSCYLVTAQVFLRREEPLKVTFYVILMAALTFNLWSGPARWSEFNAPSLALAALLGLVSTVMAISLLYLAIERIGSTYVSIFSSIEPAITVTGAYLFLGEPLVAWRLLGMGLIVTGIVLPNLGRLKEAEEGADP